MLSTFLLLTIFWSGVNAQISDQLSIFLDCRHCDVNFIKRNITSVNYSIDQTAADVNILVTNLRTGSGGTSYVFHFKGKASLHSLEFNLDKYISPDITRIERQAEFVKVLDAGIRPFISQYDSQQNKAPNYEDKLPGEHHEKPKWNFWVFRISSSLDFSYEKSQSNFEWGNDIDVERVTQDWRIRSAFDYDYEKSKVEQEDGPFISTLTRTRGSISIVKSLGDRWSTGFFLSAWENSVNNQKFGSYILGAIEHNFYPYEQSHTREFTLTYKIGPRIFNYIEPTIYDLTEETHMSHSLALSYRLIQPWGSVFTQLEGFHYFHDFGFNNVSLDSYISLRLVKGFFIRFGGEFSLIHDQLYLPKGDASLEDILLNRKALATDFELNFNVGLVYRFGALYNNIVNTRL